MTPSIGTVLRDYRYVRRIGVRQAAKSVGISPATWSRIENGKDGMDGRTMLKLIVWLFGGRL